MIVKLDSCRFPVSIDVNRLLLRQIFEATSPGIRQDQQEGETLYTQP